MADFEKLKEKIAKVKEITGKSETSSTTTTIKPE